MGFLLKFTIEPDEFSFSVHSAIHFRQWLLISPEKWARVISSQCFLKKYSAYVKKIIS